MFGRKEATEVAIAIGQFIHRIDQAAVAGGQGHAFDAIRQLHNKIGIVNERKTDRGQSSFILELTAPPLVGFEFNCERLDDNDESFHFFVLGNARYEGFTLSGFIPVTGTNFYVKSDPGPLGTVVGPVRAWLARQRGVRIGVTRRAKVLHHVYQMIAEGRHP